jgi:hypothetical protein
MSKLLVQLTPEHCCNWIPGNEAAGPAVFEMFAAPFKTPSNEIAVGNCAS